MRQFRSFDEVGFAAFLLALKREKGFDALVWLDVRAPVALVIDKAIGLCAFLQLFMGQDSAVDIEVNDMVIAFALLCRGLAQVIIQRAIGAGAQDLDANRD